MNNNKMTGVSYYCVNLTVKDLILKNNNKNVLCFITPHIFILTSHIKVKTLIVILIKFDKWLHGVSSQILEFWRLIFIDHGITDLLIMKLDEGYVSHKLILKIR